MATSVGAGGFYKVPISLIVQYGDRIPFDIYLRLSESKMIKISHKDDNVKETIVKYVNKGVTDVFADTRQYKIFLEALNREVTSKFFDVNTTPEERLKIMQMGTSIIKDSFRKVGVTEESSKLVKNMAQRTVGMLEEENLNDLIKMLLKFKQNCSSEYFKGIFSCAIIMRVLDKFEWQSDQIKEKVVQAVHLRDLLLDPEDFKDIEANKDNPDQLSNKAFNHPVEMATKLMTDGRKDFAPEVLTVIEQHHERPDGAGFPNKLDHRRMNLLSCICIVSDEYVDRMIAVKFDMEKHYEVILEMRDVFKKGNYRKALESFESIF